MVSIDELEGGAAPTPPTDALSVTPPRKPRGFAAMDPAKVSRIAQKGGKAAHAAGTAHEFSIAEARAAGRKGGYAVHAKRKESEST